MEFQRTIVPQERHFSEQIANGVFHQRLYPGGLKGPNGETDLPTPGGQTWSEIIMLGAPDDAFQMIVPDIRMPANQYWPLHWHDCWTAVVIIEGACCIGDWWMDEGDVFLTIPSLEYGPLLVGPEGCRLYEIFAQGHLSPGGYAPEYRDHPTLQGGNHVFAERSEMNARNAGHQILPLAGVDGFWKGKLAGGALWNLGEADDPERGLMKDTRLAAGETIAAHSCDDWHTAVVLGGSISIAGRTLSRDDLLLAEPGGQIETITAGEGGAQLLELSRTAKGAPARMLA